MTTFKCKTCGAHWQEGPTRDYVYDQTCRRCIQTELESPRASDAALRAEACRWYKADGTFDVLAPEEVIRRRKEAAVEIAALREEIDSINEVMASMRVRDKALVRMLDDRNERLAAAIKRAEEAEASDRESCAMYRSARDCADALAARVEALKSLALEQGPDHLYEGDCPYAGSDCEARDPECPACAILDSAPAADLAAHDARVRREALLDTCVLPSLAAAISLLERGGKRAAPSDTMFEIMLSDYKKALEAGRTAILGEAKGTSEANILAPAARSEGDAQGEEESHG